MIRSLKSKMLLIFGLIIILALVTTNYLVITKYKSSKLKEQENILFSNANIISNVYKNNKDKFFYIDNFLKMQSENINARILILNLNNKVVYDSHNILLDKKVINQEIRDALLNKSVSGIYTMDEQSVMQITVPVSTSNKVEGVVLISKSLNNVYNDINNLLQQMLLISSIALFISLALIVLISLKLTKPISKLQTVSEKISEGQLGEKVDIKTKDEFGMLGQTFNSMSDRLYLIDKNRKRFIRDLSHELKTPLASIRALVDSIIISEKVNDNTIDDLKSINSEVDRLSNMTSKLLYSLRIEEEQFNIKPHNLSELVNETIKMVNPYAQKNEVDISHDIEKDLVIDCDKDKFKEVLINLIDNSIKYKDSDKSENIVKIKAYRESEKVIIKVKDNGIGISQENLSYIFQDMFKIDENRKLKLDSYGLGLSIVKKIVELHGWHIKLESKKGKGTTFLIEI